MGELTTAIKNYTTKVDIYTSLGEIQGALAKNGALKIMTDYADGVTIGNSHRAWRIDDYGVTGKNGTICGCPKCGGCSSIVWDPVTDTNTCTCGWTDSTNNVTVQEWISVDERLPQNFVSVLGYMTDAGEFPPVRECYTVGNAFFFPSLGGVHPVSHWCEMPQPPKGE